MPGKLRSLATTKFVEQSSAAFLREVSNLDIQYIMYASYICLKVVDDWDYSASRHGSVGCLCTGPHLRIARSQGS